MPKVTNPSGIELYYELQGNPNASNKIIFVMGMGGTHRGWQPQSEYFSTLPDFQLLVFDHRGVGFSQSPPPPYHMADDVIFLADQVNFDKFNLVGLSMGGMISMHIALKIPERVKTLGLIVTRVQGGFFAGLPTFTGIWNFGKIFFAKTPESFMHGLLDVLYPSHHLTSIDDTINKTYRQKYYDQLVIRATGIPPQSNAGKKGQLAAVQSHGLDSIQISSLKSSPFPILAIVGDLDDLIKPYHSYSMPDQIGADLLIVEGAGHGVTQQCPAIVNDALLSLFSRPLSLPRNPVPEIRRVPASHIPASQPVQQTPIEESTENVL